MQIKKWYMVKKDAPDESKRMNLTRWKGHTQKSTTFWTQET